MNDLIEQQKQTNHLLEQVCKELKRNSDLVEKYNHAYHIK